MANIRSAYAEVMNASLSGDTQATANRTDGITYTAGTSGTADSWSKDVTLTQKESGWLDANKNVEIAGKKLSTIDTVGSGKKVEVKYDGTTTTITVKD